MYSRSIMLLEQKLNNLPKLMYGIFAWVGWPNIGLAAAGPTGPAPMALHKKHFYRLGGRLYTGKKKMCCFNHRVVTLFAVKLRRQWLREVFFGIRD